MIFGVKLRWLAAGMTVLVGCVIGAGSPVGAAGRTVRITPSTERETTSGQISIGVLGSGFATGAHVSIQSPALTAGCKSTSPKLPLPATVDFDGRFTAGLSASGCHPGQYLVSVTQVGAPHSGTSALFTVLPPGA